jgi:hypothetical protein
MLISKTTFRPGINMIDTAVAHPPNRVLEDVFVTEGVPEETFIDPPNLAEILVDVRHPTKPVVIEGPSGTGKTTTVKKILERIGKPEWMYLSARSPEDVAVVGLLVEDTSSGVFIIDDFHRLPVRYQAHLANIAKLAADEGNAEKFPKMVLIGINEVGSKLIDMAPDIAKRCGIHRIKPGEIETTRSLIRKGCGPLNVEFENVDDFYRESAGDYWLVQMLCKTACMAAGVTETQPNVVRIKADFLQIRERIVDHLSHAYTEAVKDFCRGRRFRPSNDPYYRILRFIATQCDSSSVDLVELANAYPEIAGSINNIKGHRLSIVSEKPKVKMYFFYNRDSHRFSVEDPAMFYFIRHLDWDKIRSDCGFREAVVPKEFDFAISFAGENRQLARFIASKLKELDVSVFYDEDYEAAFLGKKLSEKFEHVFGTGARYVVCLLDKHHRDKIWPTFERDVFVKRVEEQAVIPVYLDDTVFVGIPRELYGIEFKVDLADEEKWAPLAVDAIVLKLIDVLG